MAINLPTGPQGQLESRVGSEGRVNIPRPEAALLEGAMGLLETGARGLMRSQAQAAEAKEDADFRAVAKDVITEQTNVAIDAGRAASFNPESPMQKAIAEAEATGQTPLSLLESEAFGEAHAQREAYTRAIRQGIKPGDAWRLHQQKKLELIDRHPLYAKEIEQLMSLSSPGLEKLVAEAGADNAKREATVDKFLDQQQAALVSLGVPGAATLSRDRVESAHWEAIGKHALNVEQGARRLALLNQRSDLTMAERRAQVLEAGEPLSQALAVTFNARAASILAQAIPKEQAVAEIQSLALEMQAAGQELMSDPVNGGFSLAADDYQRLVGSRVERLNKLATDIAGGLPLQAAQNSVALTVELEKRRQLGLPGVTTLAAAGDLLRNALQANPLIIKDSAQSLGTILSNDIARQAGVPGEGLTGRPNPAKPGQTLAPEDAARNDAAAMAALLGGPVDVPVANALVAHTTTIAETTKPSQSYRALVPIINTMADSRYADTVNKSTAPLADRQRGQQLAKEYGQNVQGLLRSLHAEAGGPDAVDYDVEQGLVVATPTAAWAGDRRQRERLNTYVGQLNAAIKAYAHANGMRDYNAAANSMLGALE